MFAGHSGIWTGQPKGQTAGPQWPPEQTIAGHPVPPATGQHSPHIAPSSLHGSPSFGSLPHQQTGSGSATAHCQRPSRHVQDIAPPQGPPSFVHVAPSCVHALLGSLGSHGFKSDGHIVGSHCHSVPSHTHPSGGGPAQVGGQVEGSCVPGGHAHSPALQIGA